MASFASLFQYEIGSDAYVEVKVDAMVQAAARSSIAQYALNEGNVTKTVKDVIKKGILYMTPQVASYNGSDYMVSGRHRTEVARRICAHYGLDAKNKVQLITEANRADLQVIEPLMRVDYLTVDNMETLSGLILAANGSRTMTAPETASVKLLGGYATPSDKIKLRFAPFILANLELVDGGGMPITTSAVTAGQIAGKILTRVKNLAGATDEQLDMIASQLQEFLTDEDNGFVLPTTWAQHNAPFIVSFLDHIVTITDEDGDEVLSYDSDGEVIEVSYAQHLTSILPVKEKATAKAKKPTVDAEAFARMQAKLLELGITVY